MDKKDLKILAALDRLGGNASAQEISDSIEKTMNLRIPARTIRYRLSTMMERGILLPSFLQSQERVVGLGEKVLVVQEHGCISEELERVIEAIPIFHWYVPTHGRYDGYLIHAVYDMKNPKMLQQILKKLQKKQLIDNFREFDIVDYESKRVDFNRYRPDGPWNWNWNEWMERIPSTLKYEGASPHNMTFEYKTIECDGTDIEILKQLKQDPEMSMTTLSLLLNQSVTQIRDKVQFLRDVGVIRGSRRAYGFVGDLLWFSIFIEIEDAVDGVLKVFYDLPFPGVVLAESPNRYCFRFGLDTTDFKHFLEGFRLVRGKLNSYSFQIHLPDRVDSTYLNIFDLFDKGKDRWNMPVDDYLRLIDKS
jgi:DNA-binding Lrp family transcriptional regulator